MTASVAASLQSNLFMRLDGLHPAARLASAMMCAAPAVFVQSAPAAAFVLAWGAILVLVSGLPLRVLMQRLCALEGLTAISVATLPFTMGGSVIAHWGGFALGLEGLERGGVIMLKAAAIMMAVSALLAGMPAAQIGRGMACLGAPQRFVALMLLCVRHIEVLHDQYGRLRNAMRARAFRPQASLHCWRSYGALVGMMLVGGLSRAERIHAAMLCRGWRGDWPVLDQCRAGSADWALIGLNFAAVMAAFFIEAA